MNNPLNKRLKRDLINNAGRYIAISIIFIVAVAIISAFLVVANGVRTAFDENRTECLTEDGLFTAQTEINDNVLTEIEALNVSVNKNYYIDSDIESGVTLRVFENREAMNMRIYYGAYSLPPMKVQLNAEALLLTTVLPIVLMLIINLFALNRKLRISPLNFLRKDLNRYKNKKAVRLPEFSFISRFCLRVILQNKGSYVTLFFGILFAGFILMFGLSISPAISHYIDNIKETAVAEYQYILKHPTDAGNTGNAEKFTIRTLETYYSPADKNYEVSFYGLQKDSTYFKNLHFDSSGNLNSVVISDSLARKIGVKTGDEITFTDPYTNNDYTLTVTGTYDFPSGLSAFMDLEQLNRLLCNYAGYFNGFFSESKLVFDEKNLAAIITPEDISGLGDQMFSTFGEMAPIFLVASIVIYLVLMYILTKIVIDKNVINISFMKVFGYKEKEIRRLYLDATSITVMTSLIVTLLPISFGIIWAFRLVFIKINGYMEAYLPFYLFTAVAGIEILSYFIINFLHVGRVSKIEVAEVLKNRE